MEESGRTGAFIFKRKLFVNLRTLCMVDLKLELQNVFDFDEFQLTLPFFPQTVRIVPIVKRLWAWKCLSIPFIKLKSTFKLKTFTYEIVRHEQRKMSEASTPGFRFLSPNPAGCVRRPKIYWHIIYRERYISYSCESGMSSNK